MLHSQLLSSDYHLLRALQKFLNGKTLNDDNALQLHLNRFLTD